ncbi:hydrolase [Fimbriimonas ginsengisoli Gsoil 348]|uniref:Hydrolase n=2 Tax=Fimbriimonas ginsengisoli TaxID=1005039 RepID=A0A068NV64_FIMGI|nr:hydrolase [Fimbriimonas ginsengisoli Gsoil 348]
MVFACSALTGVARADDDVFDSNGVKIRYVTAGEGEAVVLIHGWMGDSSMWGRDAAGNTKLDTTGSKGFQIIALDCRGHGKSDKPHDASKYGAEMAADVVRLLDHLKIKKAHLIGYSMGAFIAGKVAATHPDRVLSVIYGGQAPLIVGVPASGSNEVEVFAKAVEEGKGLGPYLLEVMPPDKPKLTLEQANSIAKYLYGGRDVKAFALAGQSLSDLRVTADDLRKCAAPTLFIYGGNESAHTQESIAAARRVLGRGEVKVIEGGDHITTLAKPAFGASIMAFLRSHMSK